MPCCVCGSYIKAISCETLNYISVVSLSTSMGYIGSRRTRLDLNTELPDSSLVPRAQQGHLDSFNTLVLRYEKQVFSVALRMVGSRQQAEDVAQETFTRAYKGLKGFRGGSLKAWLLRITTNTCNDYFRSHQSQRDLSLEMLTEDIGMSLPSSDPSPEEEALRGELGQEIQRGLLTLPGDQRMVLIMVDVEGMSYQEAAEAVGISPGTLRSRLSRARAKLRDYLLQRRELLPPSFRQ